MKTDSVTLTLEGPMIVAAFDMARDIIAKRDARIEKLERAIRWACGEWGEFPEADPKRPYGWRSRLRTLADLKSESETGGKDA